MRIVLDANAIIAEDYGRSILMRTLLSASAAVGYTVCVPRLAIAEAAGKVLRELDLHSKQARRSLGQLARLTSRQLHVPSFELNLQEEAKSFEEDLRNRLVEAGVAVLPYPEVPHEELAQRAISRTRPFDEKGSGYRDSLIWFSVLQLASQTEGPVFLVAGDKDFADSSKQLHPDLKNDLERDGHPDCTVTLFESLEAIVDEHIRPHLTQVLWEDPQSTLLGLGFDVRRYVGSAIENAYGNHIWAPHELGLPPQCRSPRIGDVAQIDIYNVIDVRRLPDHRFLVKAEAEVIGLYEFILYSSDWSVLAENPRFYSGPLDFDSKGSYIEADMLMRAVVELFVHEFNPQRHQAQVVSLEHWD